MDRARVRLAVALPVLAAALGTLRASEIVRTVALRPAAGAPEERAGQVIVSFRELDEADVERAIRAAGGRSARRSAFGERYLVELPPEVGVPQAVSRFLALPGVEYAEPNGRVHAHFRPNDRLYERQWHLRLLRSERTWDIQRGDPSVIVAVLDTGVAYEDFGPFRKAPDWGGTVFALGFNVLDGSAHANDDNFHGTHVASVIAEATDNGEGVAGLCFRCAILPVKVLDDEGVGSFFDVAEGLDFAASRGAKVVNMSLGGTGGSQALRQAVDRAVAAGAVVVASAGNDGVSSVEFPAALPNVIAVGAVDARKQRASYSNFGADLDVVAPGGDLDRDDDGNGEGDGILQQTFSPDTAEDFGRYDDFAYYYVSGTSQAAPQVAALAALLVRQGITSPAAVKAAIESTAEDLGATGRDDTFGHGLIRPEAALSGLGLNR
jgi:serine protease